ncbi:MAG: winged helix-turn-helix domain-containing protein [Candidatus Bathyarchaeia archaeon]
MQIEEALGSKLRVKILKLLYQITELNVTEIARRIGSDYKTVIKHLKILEEAGFLQHKKFGRIHLYRINENSAKAKALQTLLKAWEKP